MTTQDYNRDMERQLAAEPGGALLLHSCCGPCSAAVLERLGEHFAVTLFFYNPNVSTEAEYERRLAAQKTVVEQLAVRYPVTLITAPYDPAPFERIAAGREAEPEGGLRCTHCFTLRLEETAKRAKADGFSVFTTTLSVSPHKDAKRLNEIGLALGEQYQVSYLPADFKKKDGYRRSVAIAEKLGLYRQSYCGCQWSMERE